MSGTRLAKFLQKNGVVGSGALWTGVYLPTSEKKIASISRFVLHWTMLQMEAERLSEKYVNIY